MLTDTALIFSFELGSQCFGLPVKHIREVLARPSLVKVPGAPAHLAGLINLRGEILTVLDLAPLIWPAELPRCHTPEDFAAVIDWQGQSLCLLLQPGDVHELEPQSLEVLPAHTPAALKRLGQAFWPGMPGGLILIESDSLFEPRFRTLRV